MKKTLLKILLICMTLGTISIPVYAEEKRYIGIFEAYPEGDLELPEALRANLDEEQELKYHDDAVKYYEEHKDEYQDPPEIKEAQRQIMESINAEENAKTYPKGIFKFSIDEETAKSMGLTTDLMELCIFCNGKDCYKFLLKKDEGYYAKALVKEGKYTIGYLRDVRDKEKEYSLKENSFLIHGGDTYETTIAPYIDPYEYYGIKKMTKEELEEAQKEYIENLPELPVEEQVKMKIGRAYLDGTLQAAGMMFIALIGLAIYIRKEKKKYKRPIEFDS